MLSCLSFNISALTQPDSPIIGHVTHHSIEINWNSNLEDANEDAAAGDDRIRVVLQQENRDGTWSTVYQ